MRVTVEYCANFCEQTGKKEETITTRASDVAELYAALKQQYGFSFSSEQLKVAKNNEFCNWETPLDDQDKITFVPPVAGG